MIEPLLREQLESVVFLSLYDIILLILTIPNTFDSSKKL